MENDSVNNNINDNKDPLTNMDEMSTLSQCTTSVLKKGYTDNFKITGEGLYAPSTDKSYSAEEVKINNFYRFEGASDPADSSVLYAIETNDGTKGMYINSYGANSDETADRFISKVEEIHKVEAHNK